MTPGLQSNSTLQERSLTNRLPADSARSESRFALIVGLLFYAVALFGVLHHEMWRDEYQAWMIAKSSHSLMELLTNLRYEGVGCLWHLCLYMLTRVTDKAIAMQLLHISIAACGSYIVARYSPFLRWQRVLLVFGYYSLFEYGTISRCYALGDALIFGACAALTCQYKHKYLLALFLLGLAANTSLFAAIIAGSLVLYVVLRAGEFWAPSKRLTLPLMIFCVLGVFSLLQINPPGDGFRGDWSMWQRWLGRDPALERMLRAATSVLIGYFPIPDQKYDYLFWGSCIFESAERLWQVIWAALSTFVAGIFIGAFWRRKPVLLMYCVGTALMVGFFHFVLLGAVRHYGQQFILLVCCLWIYLSECKSLPQNPVVGSQKLQKIFALLSKLSIPLFTAILVCHLGISIRALHADYEHSFSPSTQLARYLIRNNREHDFIACIPDWLGVGISGALNRPVYELGAGRLSLFTTGGAKKELSDHAEVLKECEQVLTREHLSELLLVIDANLGATNDNLEIASLKSFRNGIVMHEKLHLYLVRPRQQM